MAEKRSIFGSAFRTFFSALFGVLGLFLGIIVIVIVVGLIATASGGDVEATGRHRVIAGSDWKQSELNRHSPLLLMVNLHGVIGSEDLRPEWVRDQLVRSQSGSFEGRIHGVLLNVNTPGGGAVASDTIYTLVKNYKEHFDVPVYAFVDGICASGGFYISCAADKIYATAPSIVGSVGVISNFFNIYDTLEKVGIQPLTLTAGKNKDTLNPVRKWNKDEGKEIQSIIDENYQIFIDVVTSGRPLLTRKKLVDEFGAKVFLSATALDKGYIDGVVKSRNQVIEMLARTAEVDQQEYQVVEMESRSWIDQLVRGEHPLLSGKMTHSIEGHTPLPKGYLYLYREA